MSTNVTDSLVDQVVSQITTNVAAYFDDMDGTGYTQKDPKQVRKGIPNPTKMHSPSVYVFPERVQQVDGYMHQITMTIWYYVSDNDAERLAKAVARGADALNQLIDDKFSVLSSSYEFEYAVDEGGKQQAAAQISAEIIV